MRDTMNDQIVPACEEDLVHPDESSEFFNPEEVADVMEREFSKELEEEKKNTAHKGESLLEQLIKQRDILAEGYPKLQENFNQLRKNFNKQRR